MGDESTWMEYPDGSRWVEVPVFWNSFRVEMERLGMKGMGQLEVFGVAGTIGLDDTWPLDDLIDSAVDNSAVTWNKVDK